MVAVKKKQREQMPIVSPRVTTMLNARLRETGETWADFIRRFHAEHGEVGAKNHLYKILNGTTTVGEDGLLPLIVKSLKLNLEEVIAAVRRDKLDRMGWSTAIDQRSKLLKDIITRLEGLDERDQLDILGYIKMKTGLVQRPSARVDR